MVSAMKKKKSSNSSVASSIYKSFQAKTVLAFSDSKLCPKDPLVRNNYLYTRQFSFYCNTVESTHKGDN